MRVRDLWLDRQRRKTARHPDRGGNSEAMRWLACWTGPDGKEKTRAFQTQDAAAKYAPEDGSRRRPRRVHRPRLRQGAVRRGSGQVARPAPASARLRCGTTSRSTGCTSRRSSQTGGSSRYSPSEVLKWLQRLGETYSTSTQETAYMVLAGALDLAVADGAAPGQPGQVSHRPPAAGRRACRGMRGRASRSGG